MVELTAPPAVVPNPLHEKPSSAPAAHIDVGVEPEPVETSCIEPVETGSSNTGSSSKMEHFRRAAPVVVVAGCLAWTVWVEMRAASSAPLDPDATARYQRAVSELPDDLVFGVLTRNCGNVSDTMRQAFVNPLSFGASALLAVIAVEVAVDNVELATLLRERYRVERAKSRGSASRILRVGAWLGWDKDEDDAQATAVRSAAAPTPEGSASASSEGDSHTQFSLMAIKQLQHQLEAASGAAATQAEATAHKMLRREQAAFAALQSMLVVAVVYDYDSSVMA